MPRIFDHPPPPGDIPDDVSFLYDRPDFTTAQRAGRDPLNKYLLSGPIPPAQVDTPYPRGSIGSLLLQMLDQTIDEIYPVTSFAATPAIAERGQVLTNIALAWVYGFDASELKSQVILGPGSVPPLALDDRSVLVPGSLSVDATWTLTAFVGQGSIDTDLTVRWVDRVFWGRQDATVTEVEIEAMSSRLEAGFSEYVFTVGSDYWWLVAPDAYGVPDFIDGVSGFPNPFSDQGTVSITNAFSQTVTYRAWRSLHPQVTGGTLLG